jgi:tetratricopeptide (TPR) repeat protein
MPPREEVFHGQEEQPEVVWFAHNLIDINVYFGSVGAVGAGLVAMLLWEPREPAPEAPPRPGALAWATGCLALLGVVASGGIFISSELLHRARVEVEQSKLPEASTTLETAAAINPFDSSIFHEAGQVSLELYHKTRDPARLEAAQRSFRRAIWLSPRKVGPHTGLALSLSSEGRVDEALAELRIAQTLHPEGTQTSAIRRLMERSRSRMAQEQAATGPP